jgi:hypothetical protein
LGSMSEMRMCSAISPMGTSSPVMGDTTNLGVGSGGGGGVFTRRAVRPTQPRACRCMYAWHSLPPAAPAASPPLTALGRGSAAGGGWGAGSS